MKLFKKNENNQSKATQKLPMGRKARKAFAVYAALVCCMVFGTTTAFAANDPIAVVNNLSNFIFGLIKAVGMIMKYDGRNVSRQISVRAPIVAALP